MRWLFSHYLSDPLRGLGMSTRKLVLICVFAVAAVGVFLVVRRLGQPSPVPEDPVVQAVLDKRGKVTRDEIAPGRPVVAVRLSNAQISDDDLALLEPFPDLTALYLVGTSVTDVGLRRIGRFKKLRTLDLRMCSIGDAGLAVVEQFPHLETLVLRETLITDAGLKHIAGLTGLKTLDVSDTAITTKGLIHLKGLVRLETIELPKSGPKGAWFMGLAATSKAHLYEMAVTSDGRRVKTAAEVEMLVLPELPITPEVVAAIKTLTSLRTLDINPAGMTDEGLRAYVESGLYRLEKPAEFASSDQLESLNLSGSAVTDDGLRFLTTQSKLDTVNLAGTKITKRGVAHLLNMKSVREIDLERVAIELDDLVVFKNRPDVIVRGLELPKTDATLKRLRELGTLHLLNVARYRDSDQDDNSKEALTARRIDLSDRRVTDAGLKELAGYLDYTILDLAKSSITDSGLAALQGHLGLKELDLSDTAISDAGLEHVAGLSKLQSLQLNNTRVTDSGLKALKPLSELEGLDLADTRVVGPGLVNLKELKRLQVLRFRTITDQILISSRDAAVLHCLEADRATSGIRPDPLDLFIESPIAHGLKNSRPKSLEEITELKLRDLSITNAGLVVLRSLPNLRELELFNTNVTDLGIKELRWVPNLTSLRIVGAAVTDAGMKELKWVPRLERLTISRTEVSDAAVPDILQLNELRSFRAKSSKISDKGERAIHSGIPGLKWMLDDD